jgi:4-aminobutyrate aminotransferase-like enzyme/Ser/Thr protein kinase RdoA (MazF antagonist)/murein DD-endopeptidase MepM/ murein hydrolase activator NlpD
MIETAPSFNLAQAREITLRTFGVHGLIEALPSERDQNFLVTPHEGASFVLKIANSAEDAGMLDAQQRALTWAARELEVCPRVLPNAVGSLTSVAHDASGTAFQVWAVTVVPGTPLAHQRRRTTTLWHSLGTTTARLTRAMRGFDHPAIHRAFHWDLWRAPDTVARHAPLVEGQDLRRAIATVMVSLQARWNAIRQLPRSAIHGDLNDHNVLVGGSTADLYSRNQTVTGVVDFGDMAHSITIGELAIACAYASLGARDPLRVIGDVTAGYNDALTIGDAELDVLFDLVRARLAMSACMAAHQRRLRPGDAYLDVSQSAIHATLPAVARLPTAFATAYLRWRCGREPVPTRQHVEQYLIDADLHPLLLPVNGTRYVAVDLGVASDLLSGDAEENEEEKLTPRIDARVATAGATIGVGAYGEARLLYTAPAFVTGRDPAAEARTIHLGLDLFAPPGTPVYAPLDGVIHALHNNAARLDYGPLIILRHDAGDTPFFTLYGHLSATSLFGKHVGDRVARGECFAWLGTPAENVGWTPHLHVQIILDLLDLDTEFPGVGRASERELWRRVSPDANLVARVPEDALATRSPSVRSAIDRRHERFGANLSVAYREPVRAVRGWMQWLYDDVARRYLDAYNNVPHVGHSHPRVADAVARQVKLLSTNTRYLNDVTNEYAERLGALFPEPLRVCYLLNSASEANELALRLARSHTGRRDTIVLEGAYHGNTTTLIDISPYKHAGPGGTGAPDWVHVAPLPDDYRGPYRRGEPEIGGRYASHVGEIVWQLAAEGRSPAAFIAETCPSVGGQIMLPEGYLAEVYRLVRGAGGLVIADEVQTGLGRIGTHCWAFEAHGVVPDIVVLGKPLGNGLPLAAVVTTRAIADSFANGMEFFSTFGGNQVSCAAGLAVLDVLRDEGLTDHARRVGATMLAAMRPWMERHPLVGDVRGSGLFLGVELVRDRERRLPAAAEASYVANRLREEGILLGTDGPDHNVVKIRPPMPFTIADGERLVEVMEGVLLETGERVGV